MVPRGRPGAQAVCFQNLWASATHSGCLGMQREAVKGGRPSKTFGAQDGSFLPDKRLSWNTWPSTMTRRVCRALKETELPTYCLAQLDNRGSPLQDRPLCGTERCGKEGVVQTGQLGEREGYKEAERRATGCIFFPKSPGR